MDNEPVMSYRTLIRPEDLNSANRLFGGRIMEWADGAAAMYAMCIMERKSIVTAKVTEILFKTPAFQGDILEFYCTKVATGHKSMTIGLEVLRKDFTPNERSNLILKCEFVFVSVDPTTGKSEPHGLCTT